MLCVAGTVFLVLEDHYFSDFHTYSLLVISVVGYLIITSAFLTVIYYDEDPSKALTVLLFLPGAILNCTSGVLCFIRYSNPEDYDGAEGKTWLILGIVTISNGILMLIDVIIIEVTSKWRDE